MKSFIDDDWDVIIDNDVLPNALLGHMEFHNVDALFAHLLTLEDTLEQSLSLGEEVECTWKVV